MLALAVVLVAAAAGALALWLANGDDTDDVVASGDDTGDDTGADDGAEAGDDPARDAPPGTIRIRLESVEGIFIEGFEIGLKFETEDGELIDSTLWSEHVQSLPTTTIGPNSGAGRGDPYYVSVLDQPVPAGTIVVSAEVNIGMGPGPSIPDLGDELPCRLPVDVEPGATVTVEVGFGGGDDCLRVVTAESGASSTTSLPAPTMPDPSPDEPVPGSR